MTKVPNNEGAIDAGHRWPAAVFEEVMHEISAEFGPEYALSDDDAMEIQLLTRHAIEGTLAAADPDHPGSGRLPPILSSLPNHVTMELCQAVVAHTWHALIERADGPRRSQLLHAAVGVFNYAQQLRSIVDQVDPAADHTNGRDAIVRALLNGESAEALAARCQIKLAPSYVLALLQLDPPAIQLADERQDVLVTQDGEQSLVLLPTLLPVQRIELRAFCERALRTVATGHGRVAVASAQTRDRIVATFDEVKTVHHVALTLDFPTGIYQLADIPLEAALVRSPDLANLLAHRLLPLHGSSAPMLETLEVYLEKGQDRRKAARALHIHPNTLDYRLRRIRELTGLSPAVPHDIQTLCAAITAWRLSVRTPISGPAARLAGHLARHPAERCGPSVRRHVAPHRSQ